MSRHLSSKALKAGLDKLSAAIPTFECIPGCTDCCGPVPISAPEWKSISLHKTRPQPSPTSCSYLKDSACSIYQDRPFLCRLFGTARDPMLACPHGRGPVSPLTSQQAAQLRARYISIVQQGELRYTAKIS